MTYNSGIPQPTDRISDSQPQILTNFNELNDQYGVNGDHFEFTALTNQGKHKQVTWPDRTGSLPSPGAGECAGFGITDAATQTYPFLLRDGLTTQYPIVPIKSTAMFLAANPVVSIFAYNIMSITRVSPGVYDVVFDSPVGNTAYAVFITPVFTISMQATTGFRITAGGTDPGVNIAFMVIN